MPTLVHVSLLPAAALLLGVAGGCSTAAHPAAAGSGGDRTSSGGPDPLFGSDGHGKGDVAQAPCDGGVAAMGPIIDMPWPNPSNTNHDGDEGSSIHFHWSGSSHDVVQVASWQDYWHPSPSYADPGFPRGFKSGPKADSGDLVPELRHVSLAACGYRPGLYYFADEGNAAGRDRLLVDDKRSPIRAPRPPPTMRPGPAARLRIPLSTAAATGPMPPAPARCTASSR